jgi:hypothetical protein
MPLDSLLAGGGDPRIRRRPEPESVEFPGTGARRSRCGPATARCTRRPMPFAASEPARCSPHLFFGTAAGAVTASGASGCSPLQPELLFWTRSSATRGESGGAAVQKVEKGIASGRRRCRWCNIETDVQNFYGAYNPNGLLFQPDETVSVADRAEYRGPFGEDYPNTILGRTTCPADPLRMVSARSQATLAATTLRRERRRIKFV